MRMCSVPRQLLAVVIGGVLVGGCSYVDFFSNPAGVGAPAPSALAQYVQSTATESVFGENGRGLTAGEYVVASLSYTNEKCHAFFDTLEHFKQDSKLIDNVITAAVASGSPLVAFGSSAKAVARFTSITSFANQINGDLADIYAFSAFKEPLMTHVFTSMASYRRQNGLNLLTRGLVGLDDFVPTSTGNAENIVYRNSDSQPSCRSYTANVAGPPATANGAETSIGIQLNQCKFNEFLNSRQPSDLMVARNVAGDYASLCSLANMKKIVNESLVKTTTTVTGPDAASTKTEPIAAAELEDAVTDAKEAAKTSQLAAATSKNSAAVSAHKAEQANVAKKAANQASSDAEAAKEKAEEAAKTATDADKAAPQ